MGYARQGQGQLWTPEEAQGFGPALLRVLRGTAIPIFDETDQAGPALKVDIRPTVLEDPQVPCLLPVSFEAEQWRTCVVPILRDPMWSPHVPVNRARMRTVQGAMALADQIGFALKAQFILVGYGPG